MLKIRSRRGILEVDAVDAADAVFSQTAILEYKYSTVRGILDVNKPCSKLIISTRRGRKSAARKQFVTYVDEGLGSGEGACPLPSLT